MASLLVAELFYTPMQKTRWLATIYCAIWLGLSGCGASDGDIAGQTAAGAAGTGNAAEADDAGAAGEGSAVPIAVVQVETVTTVQSSAGVFLSPTPEQLVPTFVERNAEAPSAATAAQEERAKIDIALLFRGSGASSFNRRLNAQLVSANAGPWSTIESSFPRVEQTAALVRWPLVVSSAAAADLDSAVSPEWRGWQDYHGLAVSAAAPPSELAVPAATLAFEASGLSSPLLLSVEDDVLLVTNRSSHAVARALLIYSHPGGIGVTVLDALGPGERTVTILGPKEHPAATLLELARGQLTDFFAASVGPELAPAMAAAKSIPFLETQGLRLVALLSDELEPAVVSFSASVAAQQRVIVSHSEILKPEEEARVLGLVTDPALDAEQALLSLGRFTQAKLEFAEGSADPSVSARATSLLTALRSR
jgi:hypothetical protein